MSLPLKLAVGLLAVSAATPALAHGWGRSRGAYVRPAPRPRYYQPRYRYVPPPRPRYYRPRAYYNPYYYQYSAPRAYFQFGW
jgi:hypothetical protein